MTTDNDDTKEIQQIINDLKHDDSQIRVTSMSKILQVAKVLGVDRTKDEFLPFLKSCCDDEDIVLEILAEQIGCLVDFIGKDNSHILLPNLITLLSVEQSKVREIACKSCKLIAESMNSEKINEHFYPIVTNLNSATWYSSHISLSMLINIVYPHVPTERKEELRKFYKTLIESKTPLVRRAASANLDAFINIVEDDFILSDLLPLFKLTANDDQDYVRYMAVESCIALCSKLNQDTKEKELLPIAKKLATDDAWRVRYMSATHFCDLSKGFGENIVQAEMVGIFVQLLKDNEGEVRSAAASQITGFSQLLSEELIISSILGPISELANDSNEHVRASLAGDVMGLAPLLGKTKTLENLLDLFLKLLGDEFYEVRLSVISKLDGINQVVGIELLSDSLLPAITQLAEEKQWRVRLAIINFIPLLAKQLGVEFFDDKLSSLCFNWLIDSVYSIREAAANNIKELIQVFGIEWAQKSILPKILEFCDHPNYLNRATTLLVISSLCEVVPSDIIDSTLLPIAIRMVADNVPNLRLKVAKTFQVMMKYIDNSLANEKIKPALETLLQDTDKDVRFCATKAMHTLTTQSE